MTKTEIQELAVAAGFDAHYAHHPQFDERLSAFANLIEQAVIARE